MFSNYNSIMKVGVYIDFQTKAEIVTVKKTLLKDFLNKVLNLAAY